MESMSVASSGNQTMIARSSDSEPGHYTVYDTPSKIFRTRMIRSNNKLNIVVFIFKDM